LRRTVYIRKLSCKQHCAVIEPNRNKYRNTTHVFVHIICLGKYRNSKLLYCSTRYGNYISLSWLCFGWFDFDRMLRPRNCPAIDYSYRAAMVEAEFTPFLENIGKVLSFISGEQ